MKFEESQTYKNLQTALQGESLAYLKYTIYSNIAKEQGFGYIAKIFEETANNEKEHGEQWLKLLAPDLKNLYSDLLDATKGEHYENAVMYKDFEEKAREEGFTAIADEFKRVGSVEYHHENRYEILASLLNNKELFYSNRDTVWVCSNCGYEHTGKEAPLECPLCKHPQGYYAPRKKIYF